MPGEIDLLRCLSKTGVDARNIRNIVLMRPINSIIEFKQIIGRSTHVSFPNVTLTSVSPTEPASMETIPYTVSATGTVTLDSGGKAVQGYTNEDGSLMSCVFSEATGDPAITNVSNQNRIFVKLGTAMASSLDSATYNFYPIIIGLGTDGSSEIATLANGTVTLDANATSATVNGTNRGFRRDTGVDQVESIVAETISPAEFTVDSIENNGAVSLSRTEVNGSTLTQTLKGFVSSDRNLLILRFFSSDTSGEKEVGLVIGVRQ